MSGERWFPLKYELPDGTRLGRLLHGGSNWQIFRADRDGNLLVACSELAERWISGGLLPHAVLPSFAFGDQEFCWVSSGAGRRLAPVVECPSPESKTDGMAFALSLRTTREIETEAPLHDAIYVERYSRLLPTWSVSEEVADDEMLGRWLTGGVSVPVTSFRRLSSLLGWLNKEDVRDLVEAAGFPSPAGGPGVPEETKSDEPQELPGHNFLARAPQRRDGHAASEARREFRLAGRPALEAFFNEHIIDIVENANRYEALGVNFPSAVVLHGPPGCGKTFGVDRLVEYLDWPVFYIDSNSVGSPYIHETSRKIGEVFDKAVDAAPSLIVIDEMESFLSDRQIHESTGLHHVEEVAEFLRRIPEANDRHVLVVAMTNRLEMIDSAVLRRGRFDHVIEVEMPSAAEVSQLVDSILAKVPAEDGIDTRKVVAALTGRALSDAAFVVREAARLAARAGKRALDEAALQAALQLLPPLETRQRQIGFGQD